MISDVLHDAVEHIEQYQRTNRFAYGPLRRQINEVKRYMKGLQRYLDTPPVEPFHKESLDRLNSMLELPRGVRRTQTTNPWPRSKHQPTFPCAPTQQPTEGMVGLALPDHDTTVVTDGLNEAQDGNRKHDSLNAATRKQQNRKEETHEQ